MSIPSTFRLAALSVLLLALPVQAQEASPTLYYAYAAAESDDAVFLVQFDGQDAEVVKRIPVGFYPTENEGAHGLTMSPDGAHWYLSLAHGQPFGYLLKYETGSDELVGRTELGLFPATMSISPATGLLYAVNFNLHGRMEPSTVSVVDVETMTEITQIETGVMPHGSRLSPDGRRHYSAAMMSGELYEIDAVTLDVSRILDLATGESVPITTMDHSGMDHSGMDHSGMDHGSMDHGSMDHGSMGDSAPSPTWVSPHPSAARVYVANNGSDEILEVDTDTWTVLRRFEAPGRPYNVAVTPDGAQLVATYKGAGAIGVWDLEGGTERVRLPSSRTVTHGVVISPDSRYAFVTAEGLGDEAGVVDVIDLADGSLAATVEIGKQAGGIAFWKMEDAQP
ncbi:MAG: YncE family protein [Bacteroidota bacterium]